jgi:hypothetical protein
MKNKRQKQRLAVALTLAAALLVFTACKTLPSLARGLLGFDEFRFDPQAFAVTSAPVGPFALPPLQPGQPVEAQLRGQHIAATVRQGKDGAYLLQLNFTVPHVPLRGGEYLDIDALWSEEELVAVTNADGQPLALQGREASFSYPGKGTLTFLLQAAPADFPLTVTCSGDYYSSKRLG